MDGEALLLGESAPRALRARRLTTLREGARAVFNAVALIAVGVLIGARTRREDTPSGALARVGSSEPGADLLAVQHALIGHDKDCYSTTFTEETLMLVHEGPIMRYFGLSADREMKTGDTLKNFEASDVTRRDTRFRPASGATRAHATATSQAASGAAAEGAATTELIIDKDKEKEMAHETFVVFDNARSIGRFSSLLNTDADYPPVLLNYPDDDGTPSEFEGLAYDSNSDTFYVVSETAAHANGVLTAHITELKLPTGGDGQTDISVVGGPCNSEQTFSSENKGFEGADWLPVPGANELGGYILAVCEGNNCAGGKAGRAPGSGKIIVMEKKVDAVHCLWATAAILDIPPTANFMDYSAISLRPAYDGTDDWAIAIASQENAAVWLGRLKLNLPPKPDAGASPDGAEAPLPVVASGAHSSGSAHPARAQRHKADKVAAEPPAAAPGPGAIDPKRFELTKGRVFDFPRDNECRRVYCNIEGIAWQGEDKLVAASDQMKNAGRQDFRCWDKDQSIHTFLVPTDDMLGDHLDETRAAEAAAAAAEAEAKAAKSKGGK